MTAFTSYMGAELELVMRAAAFGNEAAGLSKFLATGVPKVVLVLEVNGSGGGGYKWCVDVLSNCRVKFSKYSEPVSFNKSESSSSIDRAVLVAGF